MRRELIRILVFGLLLAGGAAERGASIPRLQGLDTVIRELPRRVIGVREMVAVVGRECGFEVTLDDQVSGRLSIERLPTTARSILNATLPERGFLYLVEGQTLRVMPEEDLRGYFRRRAVSRAYSARVTPGLIRRLLDTPDLVSTMGYIGIDPNHGIVHVHDLPWFVRRVEEILVASSDHEVLITL